MVNIFPTLPKCPLTLATIARFGLRLEDHAESPIEKLLIEPLIDICVAQALSWDTKLMVSVGIPGDDWATNIQSMRTNDTLEIIQLIAQARIGEFRADFLLIISSKNASRETNRAVLAFVIECDGHDFHERTPEQAIRDRSRDRAMQDMGITVLRFTGREIVSDPYGCAHAVWNSINHAIERERGDRHGS